MMDGKQEPEPMFYFTSVVTLLAYISKENPIKQSKDSALFWAKVYSVKSDEKRFARLRLSVDSFLWRCVGQQSIYVGIYFHLLAISSVYC